MRALRWLPILLPALAAAQPAPRPQPPDTGSISIRPPARPEPPQPVDPLIPPAVPQPDSTPAPSTDQAPKASPFPAALPKAPEGTASPAPESLRETALDLSTCHLALHILGTRFTVEPAVTEAQGACGIAQPVRVTEVLPGITMEGGAVMRCATARALARWMREEVMPAAGRLPNAPRPIAVTPGTTYDCRMRVGDSAGPNLSEHALGNAIDVAALAFDDGTRLEIGRPEGNDLPAAFLRAIQPGACLHFTTVLGPGSNAAHAGHLHLDIKDRNGGYRICE